MCGSMGALASNPQASGLNQVMQQQGGGRSPGRTSGGDEGIPPQFKMAGGDRQGPSPQMA